MIEKSSTFFDKVEKIKDKFSKNIVSVMKSTSLLVLNIVVAWQLNSASWNSNNIKFNEIHTNPNFDSLVQSNFLNDYKKNIENITKYIPKENKEFKWLWWWEILTETWDIKSNINSEEIKKACALYWLNYDIYKNAVIINEIASPVIVSNWIYDEKNIEAFSDNVTNEYLIDWLKNSLDIKTKSENIKIFIDFMVRKEKNVNNNPDSNYSKITDINNLTFENYEKLNNWFISYVLWDTNKEIFKDWFDILLFNDYLRETLDNSVKNNDINKINAVSEIINEIHLSTTYNLYTTIDSNILNKSKDKVHEVYKNVLDINSKVTLNQKLYNTLDNNLLIEDKDIGSTINRPNENISTLNEIWVSDNWNNS